jgi:hypothetical protein
MLREIRLNRTSSKHWFQDEYFDLFIWQDDNHKITSFQLCYDCSRNERVLLWDYKTGFGHYTVDDGEASPFKNMSPIFYVKNQVFPYKEVISKFVESSIDISENIRGFIIQKLNGYVQQLA